MLWEDSSGEFGVSPVLLNCAPACRKHQCSVFWDVFCVDVCVRTSLPFELWKQCQCHVPIIIWSLVYAVGSLTPTISSLFSTSFKPKLGILRMPRLCYPNSYTGVGLICVLESQDLQNKTMGFRWINDLYQDLSPWSAPKYQTSRRDPNLSTWDCVPLN